MTVRVDYSGQQRGLTQHWRMLTGEVIKNVTVARDTSVIAGINHIMQPFVVALSLGLLRCTTGEGSATVPASRRHRMIVNA